jgi:hypothetical protein
MSFVSKILKYLFLISISVTLKPTHFFLAIRLHQLFPLLWWEELTLQVCPCTLDTPCTRRGLFRIKISRWEGEKQKIKSCEWWREPKNKDSTNKVEFNVTKRNLWRLNGMEIERECNGNSSSAMSPRKSHKYTDVSEQPAASIIRTIPAWIDGIIDTLSETEDLLFRPILHNSRTHCIRPQLTPPHELNTHTHKHLCLFAT